MAFYQLTKWKGTKTSKEVQVEQAGATVELRGRPGTKEEEAKTRQLLPESPAAARGAGGKEKT